MSTAGIVIYKFNNDGTLEGRWTHKDLQGQFAKERAWGGKPGELAGNYSVEIMTPDDHKIFEGTLTIAKVGAAYSFNWSGTQLLPARKPARYSGIGAIEPGDTVVATFQQDELIPTRATLREVWDRIPGPKGERYAEALKHGSLRVLLYAPRGTDVQEPHQQDEVYIVMKGSGRFVLNDVKQSFAEGDVLFAPANTVHRFEDFTDDLVAWVIFYGPMGGEAGQNPRKEIEAANVEFGIAYERGDAEALAKMYTMSAQLFPPNDKIVDGQEAIEKYWQRAMQTEVKGIQLQTNEVESLGNTAVETGTANLYGKDGSIINTGKYVVIWKRTDGKWQLHRDCWNTDR